jgi:hypothetical protein
MRKKEGDKRNGEEGEMRSWQKKGEGKEKAEDWEEGIRGSLEGVVDRKKDKERRKKTC